MTVRLSGTKDIDTAIPALTADIPTAHIHDVILALAIPVGAQIFGTGAADLLYGSNGNDVINGLGGNDNLQGGLGQDVLAGGAGDDYLDGNEHADRMEGGAGNDIYRVDDYGDVVVEAAGQGDDLVVARISYSLVSTQVENLILIGSAVTGQGNGLDNLLLGNDGDNLLQGMDGNDRIVGGAGNDRLHGAAGDDHLVGGDGHDRFNGQQGADRMEGNNGNDTYYIDDYDDQVIERPGEGYNDRIFASISYSLEGTNVENLILEGDATSGSGNAEANRLTGNSRDNALSGAGGSDRLLGGLGRDELQGEAGDDMLDGGADDDRLFGGDGDDILYGGTGFDEFHGGSGNDVYYLDEGVNWWAEEWRLDIIYEDVNGGIDTVYVDSDNVADEYYIDGNIENIIVLGSKYGAYVVGNDLPNVMTDSDLGGFAAGEGGDDQIDGRGGNDQLHGDAGDDVIRGGAGFDYLLGGAGNDILFGEEGDDRLQGDGPGLDQLFGGAGNDELGGSGNDKLGDDDGATEVMDGGVGDDLYIVDSLDDQVREDQASGGFDSIRSYVNFILAEGAWVEYLESRSGRNPNLTGNSYDQTLVGNAAQNDLNGMGGDDVLIGHGGVDRLTGGEGADIFQFSSALVGRGDIITDYATLDDGIALDRAIFTALTPGVLAADAFRRGTAAMDADDRILYDEATGALYYDADGQGAQVAVQFATVTSGLALSAAEFVVI